MANTVHPQRFPDNEIRGNYYGSPIYSKSPPSQTELRKWCVEQALIITGRNPELTTIAVADEILAWVSK